MRIRPTGVTSREIDGSVMVLDLASNTYHALGGAGVLLYRLLKEHDLSEDELVQGVLETYAVGEDQARKDVHGFLTELTNAGLLDVSAWAPSSR